MSYCLVVPHYNHAQAFEVFLPKLNSLNHACIVVDDGSDAKDKAILADLLSGYPNIDLVEHMTNRGKGAAMWTGAHAARMQGHTHMIQIDADGQHDVEDVMKFIEVSKSCPDAIISGSPVFDDSAPKARVYGRKITDFWVALETGSLKIKDSLCGFRVYPLEQFEYVFDKYHIGKRMQFDTDVLVKSVWEGVEVKFIDTQVVYLNGGASHFNYLDDNLRLIWLHIRLMVRMLVSLPFRIIKKNHFIIIVAFIMGSNELSEDSKTHWASVKESGTLFGLRFLRFIHDFFGRWLVSLMLFPTVGYFLIFRPLARRSSQDYLKTHYMINIQCIGNHPPIFGILYYICRPLQKRS